MQCSCVPQTAAAFRAQEAQAVQQLMALYISRFCRTLHVLCQYIGYVLEPHGPVRGSRPAEVPALFPGEIGAYKSDEKYDHAAAIDTLVNFSSLRCAFPLSKLGG